MGERAGEDDAGHVRVDAGRVFRLFPSTQRDLNMGFLLILTQAYHHPTGHLLLITRVIGSEAWVEVKPLEQSEMSVYQQDPLHPRSPNGPSWPSQSSKLQQFPTNTHIYRDL